MTAFATFALFMGILIVFILGIITGAALATLGIRGKSDRSIGVGYRPEHPVKTKVRGGGIEEDTRH